MKRINFLDGFRGLAIVLVLFFHAFVRWTKNVPYGTEFSSFSIFKNGWLGVQLFFLISGFVILMSLEKSTGFIQFIKKRWLRLFPTMLIATIFIFVTATFFYERPNGLPNIIDIFPGLLFINASYISTIFKLNIVALEGSFWSLFVETKFYLVFGFFYFYKGRSNAIALIFVLFLISLFIKLLAVYQIFVFVPKISFLIESFGFSYYGWFTSGALMYLYYTNKNINQLRLAILIGTISVVSISTSFEVFIYATSLLTLFIFAVCNANLQLIFANKFLVYFGFISYPLYLLHENMIISMINKINKYFVFLPNIFLPLLALLFLVGISHLITKFIEPHLHKYLSRQIF